MASEERLALEGVAREYLARELGPRAPAKLVFEGRFDERPLEGEGAAAIFSFLMSPPSGLKPACHDVPPEGELHYVAVGETTPNYFPSYGLPADDAYSVHIGTRFMLELGVSRIDDALEPAGARRRTADVLREAIRGGSAASASVSDVQMIDEPRLAALFRVGDEMHAVYRVRVGEEDVYCMGGDCPAGFYRMTNHPPQAAYRLHLGKLIRAEARENQE